MIILNIEDNKIMIFLWRMSQKINRRSTSAEIKHKDFTFRFNLIQDNLKLKMVIKIIALLLLGFSFILVAKSQITIELVHYQIYINNLSDKLYQVVGDWSSQVYKVSIDDILLTRNQPIKMKLYDPATGVYLLMIKVEYQNNPPPLAATINIKQDGWVIRSVKLQIPQFPDTYPTIQIFSLRQLYQSMAQKEGCKTIQITGLQIIDFGSFSASSIKPPKICFTSQCTQMICSSFGKPCCGNSIIEAGEQCDNGKRPGCKYCKIQPGYICSGTPSMCSLCGDGIKTPDQQCDNARRQGCPECKVQLGWSCFGRDFGTSICLREQACGNSIIESGQECDNGNKLGCVGCKITQGYKCYAVGGSSVCSMCGNNLVQYGEQCDNGNNQGCVNCLIQPEWQCRGISNTQCYRANSKCGNGVIQVEQGCDDGNNNNGDGCNMNCFIQDGFYCYGDMGQRFQCY